MQQGNQGVNALYITRQDETRHNPERSNDIFIGDVWKQDLITDKITPSLRVTSVSFRDGARNRWHTHTTEQVLVVTSGRGIVANDAEEREITVGDVVAIQPGERHWHGAAPGTDMTHLAILLPGKMEFEQ
jgi:quercetin dioxygenase-like cupin family protein